MIEEKWEFENKTSDDKIDDVLNNLDVYLKKALRLIKMEKNISSYELAKMLGLDPMIFMLYIQNTLVSQYNRKYFIVKEMAYCNNCKKYYEPSITYCPICGRKTTKIYIFNSL